MTTLIEIQQDYIDTVNAGCARWAHSPAGGHAHRIARGARRTAERRLRRQGWGEDSIRYIIDQARQVAELERLAEG